MTTDAIKAEALRLPPDERAKLARELLSSLDAGCEEDVERHWADEAERRYQQFLQQGGTTGIPADQALREARNRLV